MTIVELLVALSIVMVVFAALASTLIAAFSGIRSNEARVRATALANEAIEDLSTMPWATLGLSAEDTSLIAKLQELDDVAAVDNEWSVDADGRLEFATIDNELVVLLADSPDVPTHEPVPIERDGRFYTLERWVTFVEEDGGADLKRISVTVSWEQAGREQSITSESLRAPDPDDLFNLEVTDLSAFRVGSTPEEDKVAISETGQILNAFVVRATIARTEADVVLTFRDRSGSLRVRTAPKVEGETVREFTISQTDSFTFPHGPVSMLVTATGPDGQVASNSTPMRFYQDVDIESVRLFQGPSVDDLSEAPVSDAGRAELSLEPDCSLSGVVRIEADIAGLTVVESAAPEAIVVDFAGLGEIVMGSVSTTVSGGVFGVDLTGDQADPDFSDQQVSPGDSQFIIEAQRRLMVDNEFIESDFNDNDDTTDNPFLVDLIEPVGGCTS